MSLRAVVAVHVQVGKEGNAAIHHVFRSGDNTGAAAEPCQPMTQATMGALSFDGPVLSLIRLADPKLTLINDVVVRTKEADTPAFQSFEQPPEGGCVAIAAFPIHQTTGLVINGRPNPQFVGRSEEHTSELQSRQYLVCRLLLEKKKNNLPE